MQRDAGCNGAGRAVGTRVFFGVVVLDGLDARGQRGHRRRWREGCWLGSRRRRRARRAVWGGSRAGREERVAVRPLRGAAGGREAIVRNDAAEARLAGGARRIYSGSPERPVHGSSAAGAVTAASCAHRSSWDSSMVGSIHVAAGFCLERRQSIRIQCSEARASPVPRRCVPGDDGQVQRPSPVQSSPSSVVPVAVEHWLCKARATARYPCLNGPAGTVRSTNRTKGLWVQEPHRTQCMESGASPFTSGSIRASSCWMFPSVLLRTDGS